MAKLRQAHVGEKVPGDIIEHQEDDWIPLVTVFDLTNQLIFVQKGWRFGNELQIAAAIEAGLRAPILAMYNHRVFVEVRSRKEDFWKVVSSHKRIYRLELKFVSPNILDTNKKAREALADLKALYGQDEAALILENESGALRIPAAPVADYIDYIAEGEGKWTVITEGEHGGKKRHSSESAAISIDLPIPTEQEILSEGQLEFETGSPAPGRRLNDVRLVAEAHSGSKNLGRQKEDV